MRSFSLALLVALLGRPIEAFVTSPSTGRCRAAAFLPTLAKQQQPLFVSTELTAEAVGQSAEDAAAADGGETSATSVADEAADEETTTTPVAEEVQDSDVVAETEAVSDEEAPAPTAAAADDDDDEESGKRIERVRHTLFVGNLPFGKQCAWGRKDIRTLFISGCTF